mmetsp:Transcript_22402/g.70158  ORF Transcript_22402/g.70158 Transcript_22402/m.70158 type:complete len:371 (-) Transcript_22402:11-1123(-)
MDADGSPDAEDADRRMDASSLGATSRPLATGGSVICSEEEIVAVIDPLLKVRPESREFWNNLDVTVEIKGLIEGVVRDILRRNAMDQFENITPSNPPIQEFVPEGVSLQEQLDALYDRAPEAKAIFDAFCRELVRAIGLDPDTFMLQVSVDGDHDKDYSVYTTVPPKLRERSAQKALNEYDGNVRRLVDVVRASIVVDNEDDLEAVVKRLNENYVANERDGVRVVRFKNRFKHPMLDGGRDTNYNIVVVLGDGSRFVCEVQVHVKQVLNYNHAKHRAYEFFREFFKGGSAVRQRIELLETIAKKRDVSDVARIVKSALDGTDEDELEALDALFRMLSELNIVVEIRRRLLDLASSEIDGGLFKVAMRLNN